jgi:hypothetical protein
MVGLNSLAQTWGLPPGLYKPHGLALPIAGNATIAAAVRKTSKETLVMAASFKLTVGTKPDALNINDRAKPLSGLVL